MFTTINGAKADMRSLGNALLFEMQLRKNPTPQGKCQFSEWDVETLTFWKSFTERLAKATSLSAIRREAERFRLDLEEFIEACESL